VGALSGAAGLGTWALFEDSETFAASMGAGEVGVTIDCDRCEESSDGTVTFDISGLEPGNDGSERFTVTADANPVRVWLRTNCPEPVDPLGDGIEVQLSHDGDCDGQGTVIHPADGSWVTLNEFRTALRGGIRLDDLDGEACLDGELCLDLNYRLPTDATWAADLSTELTFEVAAEQCRHVPEDGVTSPFPFVDCPELDCPDCVELGKVDVPDDQLIPGQTYGFGDTDDYAIEVLTVTNKADEYGEETVCASFALLANGSEADAAPICSVAVKGGPETVTYDVDPPSTRTTEELRSPGDGDSSPGELPAISNLTISVCDEDDGDDGDDCASCPPDGEEEEGDRIAQATFSYAGPDGVDVLFDQQTGSGGGNGNGNSNNGNGTGGPPEQDVEQKDVDNGDTFTVPLLGNGIPNFDVSVSTGEDDAGTPLLVPAQSDPSALHTSCSQTFAVGMELVDDVDDPTYTLTVESAQNKAGDLLCEVSD
jgi:hypothetical protein